MNQGRCQICGRRQGLKVTGGIRFHNVRGIPCLGANAPPIEVDDAHLADLAAAAWAAQRDLARQIRDLHDRRANWIDPALVRRERDQLGLAVRLDRRLKRLHDWPARFAREMETRGWGTAPPAYLTDRTPK